MGREAGEKFGHYRLERMLGRGGMAEAWGAVRADGPATRVCLKRVLPGLRGDTEMRSAFLREARISASLRHVHIARVVDYGELDAEAFIAFEWVDGCDLRQLLRHVASRRERLPLTLVIDLARSVAGALAFAHARNAAGETCGVVHRDLSPSNILLSRSGELKLADFGIARAMGDVQLTRTGIIKGKLPYMAPEYAREARIHAGIDLFALGVILYELIAGRRPYDGRNDAETLLHVAAGKPVPLAALAPDAPPALVTLVMQLIAADPEARPRDGREVRLALADLDATPTASAQWAKRVVAATEPPAVELPGAETVVDELAISTVTPLLGEPTEVTPGLDPGTSPDVQAPEERALGALPREKTLMAASPRDDLPTRLSASPEAPTRTRAVPSDHA